MCVLSVRLVPSPCGRTDWTDPDICPDCPACPRAKRVKRVEEANAYCQAKPYLLLGTP
jgi:hypothetical protein